MRLTLKESQYMRIFYVELAERQKETGQIEGWQRASTWLECMLLMKHVYSSEEEGVP